MHDLANIGPTISVFELFSVGIGPSSSHTVGPMRAAAGFAARVADAGLLPRVARVRVDLYGSLAATGRGHGTFDAVAIGLEGDLPDRVDPAGASIRLAEQHTTGILRFGGAREVPFSIEDDVILHPLTMLPKHPNGMRFAAFDETGAELFGETSYSVGGGFVEREDEPAGAAAPGAALPLPFSTAAELLAQCRAEGLSFSGVMLRNEAARRPEAETRAGLLERAAVMRASVWSSADREGELPGGLHVRRRAARWLERLRAEDPDRDPARWQEWVNFVALAVNEENASGGRIVTAPTNGAAGIIPAVLDYALEYLPAYRGADDAVRDDATARFLLAAGAVGILYKTRASISGAEVGCQGEVGSAASMAAAGLAELMGGTPEQVENAAEIAMEHNLGLTCDPIGGLVQIPCIERNAIAAARAVNAAQMALWGDGSHHVTLDQVIDTMRETGRDMSHKYKETALGGLAVNVIEC
ncbi:L-serine ammonia-lyase [Agromyces seonyuensis]|uniref:L-serine dehydratase n=1 Tax=Agromyces seonyuensis TaxID=2662446 RepID=A0A6I4P389_9MICO|nr:L-serine ammonia-lyase [Agromyces seonyuensis]MWB97777.1 L-serine ammonia-lyase [Agromyces seonyuensis]